MQGAQREYSAQRLSSRGGAVGGIGRTCRATVARQVEPGVAHQPHGARAYCFDLIARIDGLMPARAQPR